MFCFVIVPNKSKFYCSFCNKKQKRELIGKTFFNLLKNKFVKLIYFENFKFQQYEFKSTGFY